MSGDFNFDNVSFEDIEKSIAEGQTEIPEEPAEFDEFTDFDDADFDDSSFSDLEAEIKE